MQGDMFLETSLQSTQSHNAAEHEERRACLVYKANFFSFYYVPVTLNASLASADYALLPLFLPGPVGSSPRCFINAAPTYFSDDSRHFFRERR